MGGRATDTFIEIPKIVGCLSGDINSGGLHSDMTTIKIGAMRGRNPENQNDRTASIQTEQRLEINENGTSNTLTSVAKDNLVVGTWRTHKDGQGFRKVSDGNAPTIPARAREDGSGQPVISNHNSIRRLTEIECERLQGFPDDWTKFGTYDGTIKEIPKTQRYKMLGNAVTVKVVEEVAKKLLKNEAQRI